MPVTRFYLRQLGTPELAEQIRLSDVESGGFVTPGSTDYVVTVWQEKLRDIGVLAFSRQQFSESKRAFETLISTKPQNKNRLHEEDRFQGEATHFLAEIARRQNPKDTPRPTEEIAGLMWDLQNARVTRPGDMGGTAWSSAPEIQRVFAVGELAMDALIDTLEKDQRLTLSLSGVRIGPPTQVGGLGSVSTVALYLINGILDSDYYADYQVGEDGGHSAMVAQIRADWAKLKQKTPAQRLFSILAQSGQKPELLEETIDKLLRLKFPKKSSVLIVTPGTLEELLAMRNPSVSDVLVARINELSERAEKGEIPQALLKHTTTATGLFSLANELLMALWQWDAPRALPLMAPQLKRTQKFVKQLTEERKRQGQFTESEARLNFLRAQKDTAYNAQAMEDYGQWLSSVPLGWIQDWCYGPLWRYPDEPALQKATAKVFAEKSPFQIAAQYPDDAVRTENAFKLLSRQLVRLPIAREAVERELRNQTIVATLEGTTNEQGLEQGKIKVTAWKRTQMIGIVLNHPLENGDSQPLRVADLVGYYLQQKSPVGSATHSLPLLDVSLPQKERDIQIQKIIELVRKGETYVQ
ncbi:hypothetical protein EON83_14745 [bacterium]|nr:MAG: hypothetical protein EON83_14745 [bacterium]